MWKPIASVLGEADSMITSTIDLIEQGTAKNKHDVILKLSIIRAKLQVALEVAAYMDDSAPTEPKSAPAHNVAYYMDDIEEDNPDIEDIDSNKAREDNRGFFG